MWGARAGVAPPLGQAIGERQTGLAFIAKLTPHLFIIYIPGIGRGPGTDMTLQRARCNRSNYVVTDQITLAMSLVSQEGWLLGAPEIVGLFGLRVCL